MPCCAIDGLVPAVDPSAFDEAEVGG